jgi:hypothetical protein
LKRAVTTGVIFPGLILALFQNHPVSINLTVICRLSTV